LTLISSVALTGSGIAVYLYGQQDRAQSAEVIVILGAGTRMNGVVSPNYARRIRHAIALYQRGLAPYVLCTGGPSSRWRGKTEAQACVEFLIEQGIPTAAILREDISRSTEENAIEAVKVMRSRGMHTAIVVSDNFHLLRAEWLFSDQGVTVFTSPAQLTSGALRFTSAVTFTLREVLAIGWQVVKSALQLPVTETPF
jgi:uncharacterized SAM-binding protein YcdF (DUF218 family)